MQGGSGRGRRAARAGPVTQADVARLAGVSSTVVSYVLNNGPRPVAPQTRVRVQAAMDRLGYRPDAGARTLHQRHPYVLGVVVPDVGNPFYADLTRELELAVPARIVFRASCGCPVGRAAPAPREGRAGAAAEGAGAAGHGR